MPLALQRCGSYFCARRTYRRAPTMLPGYAFIKTHKVGGTTVMYLLKNTLSYVHNTTQCDYFNKRISNITPDPTKTPGCRVCAGHDSYRQIAASIRSPLSLIAQRAVRKICPFWVPERRINTMIMLRDPVDRLYARYHYERADGWCRRTSKRLLRRTRGCASDHYQFVEWALLSDAKITNQRLYRSNQILLHAETVVTLGGKGGVTEALRVLKLIHVVGLTSRFNDTLRMLSVTWGLPLHVLKQHLKNLNAHTQSRPAINTSFKFDMLAQSLPLQHEYLLYKYASHRLDYYNED